MKVSNITDYAAARSTGKVKVTQVTKLLLSDNLS